MIHDFEACAVRSNGGLLVRMQGKLSSSADRVEIAGYYPGTIFFVRDPGYALIMLASRVQPGPGLEVLTPWQQSLPLKSNHNQVHIVLDNAPLATVPVESGFVVAVLTGGINPSMDYQIFPADQPILSIYTVVYGPASRSWCDQYIRDHGGGVSFFLREGAMGSMQPTARGGEIPVPYRTASGNEHPWPLKLPSDRLSAFSLAGLECTLADAESIAASQSGENLTIYARVWVPSAAWHPVLTRSMLDVEPPGFILSRCRLGPERPMKMVLADIEQTFLIGAPRETIKVATEKGPKTIAVKTAPADKTFSATAANLLPGNFSPRTAIGRSKAFKFDEAHADAIKELDKQWPPSSTFTSTRVEAIGTESGCFSSSLYVVVSRVM